MTTPPTTVPVSEEIQQASAWVRDLRASMGEVIVGQEGLVHSLFLSLLTGGHVLLEGVPGLAKTLAVSTLAKGVQASFARIQFTPDLLPSDLVGTEIYNAKEANFTVRKGPIFANFVLADEVNRAPSKVQSALLEAMQERQVSIGGQTFPLPRPFLVLADEINRAPAKVQSALLEAMQERQVTIANTTFQLDPPFLVLATQNPIEQEGTYPLPEAQVDRFMLKLKVTYPTLEEERRILDAMAVTDKKMNVKAVVEPQAILDARKVVDEIYVDDEIKDYILSIIFATRQPDTYKLDIKPYIRYGASPRATIFLTVGAKAHAFLQGRGYVTPQDVKSVAPDILRHRLLVSYEAEAEDLTSEDIINRILSSLPVP